MKTKKPLIQESFDSEARTVRPRDIVAPLSLFLNLRGKLVAVLSVGTSTISITGANYQPGEATSADLIYKNVIIKTNLNLLCEFSTSDVTRFKIDGALLDLNQIEGFLDAQSAVHALATDLPTEFVNSVLRMSGLLHAIKLASGKAESKMTYLPPEETTAYEEAFSNEIASYLQSELMTELNKLFAGLRFSEESAIAKATEFARSLLSPILAESIFYSRVYEKPLGYAGDFEVMRQSYRNGFEGRTLFAKSLHRFFMQDPATQSIRNRSQYLFAKIQAVVQNAKAGEVVRFASVACGPAFEWELLLTNTNIPEGVDVHVDLYDQDLVALDAARVSLLKAVLPHKNVKIRFLNVAVKNLIETGFTENNYDMIYTAGLFDYLRDEVCKRTAVRMHDALKDGGLLLIGNESPLFPSIPIMELLLDWRLIYRSSEELLSLFSLLSGYPIIEAEPLGINLFYNLIKSAT